MHHEVLHDRFDESRNIYFKLNELARYEYQSLRLEVLRLILANTWQNHYNLLQDDLLRRSHKVMSMKISSRTTCNVILCHLAIVSNQISI